VANGPAAAAAGAVGAAAGAARAASGGRITPQNLDNFLSLRGSGGRFGALASQQGLNVARTGTRGNVSSFNNVNIAQINRVNNNLNAGFRHYHGNHWHGSHGHWHHGNWHRGYGFSRFGFGFASPYWNNWAFGVRSYWNPWGYNSLFTPRFWATNYCYFPWRRSYYWWGGYPSSYWWGTPTWVGLQNWFPSYGWSDPYYYGYGPGGNIILNSGSVYIDDQPIATVEDYAASAAELATVPEPVNPDAPTEWLPLGTFALSEGESDTSPSRVVQLAVDKEGIVSGTMVNQETKEVLPIQGRVDKETQRVAFTIGDAKDVVFETGVYNLTQQQTPILAHGDARHETYLMLRLEQPAGEGTAATAGERAAGGAVAVPPAPPAASIPDADVPANRAPAISPPPPPVPDPELGRAESSDPEIVPPAPRQSEER
jgi:hypothetical protein